MRILVTGASGLIGSHTARALLARGHRVIAAGGAHTDRIPDDVRSAAAAVEQLDLADLESLTARLEEIAADADAVIHAAAMPDFATCEQDPVRAQVVNVEATDLIASWCVRHRARLVFLSTDQVFDGRGTMYVEADAAHPLQTYGRTKLEAESRVLGSGAQAVVARLALTYGASPSGDRSASESIVNRLRRGERIRLFTDEYRTPILAEDAARALAALATIENPPPVVHVAGPQRVSRHDFGIAVASAFGLDASLIDAAQARELTLDPPRAPDLSMSTLVLSSLLDDPPRNVAAGLDAAASQGAA